MSGAWGEADVLAGTSPREGGHAVDGHGADGSDGDLSRDDVREVEVVLGGVANGDGDCQPDDYRNGITAVVRLDVGHMGHVMHGHAEAGPVIPCDEVTHDSGGEAEPGRILTRAGQETGLPKGPDEQRPS